MKIERFYYTIEQLANHWGISIDDVIQLGETDRLEFCALADWYYPDTKYTERGAHTKINSHLELSNIIRATLPFTVVGNSLHGHKEVSYILKGDRVEVTYYPGTTHLIIQASEVERFEQDQKKPQSSQGRKRTQRELERDEDFKLWIQKERPDLDTITWKQIQKLLEERNGKLWIGNFPEWVKYQPICKKKCGAKPKKPNGED